MVEGGIIIISVYLNTNIGLQGGNRALIWRVVEYLTTPNRCGYDWLAVYDGPSSRGSPLLGRFCGDSLPGNNGSIISTRNVLSMQFRSDHSVSDHGFHLMYNTTTAQCGGLVTGVTTGNSPLPPGHVEETQRWETDIVSRVQLNGHTQTSAPGV